MGGVSAPARGVLQSEPENAREDLLIRAYFIEDNIRRLLVATEETKDYDPQWLAAARMDLQKGIMCLRRAITRKDFF